MTVIDSSIVRKVASLARLKLTDEEVEKFSIQLEDILTAFKKIDEVNTEKVEPSFQPQKIANVWREDEAKQWQWQPLANAKQKEKGQFKGPKIV